MSEPQQDDYFEYQNIDVTQQGLGEIARRRLVAIDAHSFSFSGGPIPFTHSPLCVQHGLSEDPLGTISVPNVWQWQELEKQLVAATPPPQSWGELLQRSRQQFSHLIIANTIELQLQPTPFSAYGAERVAILLTILNDICQESLLESGELTPRGRDLLNNFFVGRKALFTDESETNNRDFKNEMTFADPSDVQAPPIFCSWHGKIKPNQLRIHFQWPRPSGQRQIKVVYVGPKKTKH
ncbi:MAG: hypothetical protein HQL94_08060 [Magnetococcales bacterium]|nr:hypothetical protein [Magnetococcales bacterium]